MEIPIYDVVLGDNDEGLMAVSFVDFPAISKDFVFYNKVKESEPEQCMPIYLSDAYKREVVSPLLIPNQLILRKDEASGAFYYARWSAKTIEKVKEKFIAEQKLNNVTIMHPMEMDKTLSYDDKGVLENDVYLIKLWTVEDENTDEINTTYDLHLPVGTLCAKYKIHNRKLWQRIVSGELKGLSIEAYISLVPTDSMLETRGTQEAFSKENGDGSISILPSRVRNVDVKNKLDMTILDRVRSFCNDISVQVEDIEKLLTKDDSGLGEVTATYSTLEGDTLTVHADGSVTKGEEVMPDGEYPIGGDQALIITNGKFVEVRPIEKSDENDPEQTTDDNIPDNQAEEPLEPSPAEPLPPTTMVSIEIDGVEYLVPQEVSDYINALVAEQGATASTVEGLRKDMEALQGENEELKKIVPSQAQLSLNKVDDSKGVSASAFIAAINRKLS